MSSSARGIRVLKALNFYTKGKPDYFDTKNIFNKINLSSLSDGIMKGSFTVDKSMCNVAGTLHGGFIASALDALAVYAQLSLPDSRACWTTNSNLNFMKSSKIGETVLVETSVLKAGQHPIMEAIMKDESGAVLAKNVLSFRSANEHYQQLLKKYIDFDVYEK